MSGQDRGLEIEVEFYGLRTLTAALRQVEPELYKELFKTTKRPMQDVMNRARRMVPTAEVPSGWKRRSNGPRGWGDPSIRGWDNSKVRGGIRIYSSQRTATGVVNLHKLVNSSPAGSIYEKARSSDTPQGQSFVRKMNRLPTSRLIWRAWDESGGDSVLRPAVADAIREIEAKFMKRAAMVEGGDKIVL
jgi:hypothetical protein